MLQQQAETEGGDFVAFAAEVARFLAFKKQLATPTGAVLELVAQGTDGALATHALWGVMNLGEDPLTLAWSALRLELRAGEGCQLPRALPAVVLPPAAEPHLLLVVRGAQRSHNQREPERRREYGESLKRILADDHPEFVTIVAQLLKSDYEVASTVSSTGRQPLRKQPN